MNGDYKNYVRGSIRVAGVIAVLATLFFVLPIHSTADKSLSGIITIISGLQATINRQNILIRRLALNIDLNPIPQSLQIAIPSDLGHLKEEVSFTKSAINNRDTKPVPIVVDEIQHVDVLPEGHVWCSGEDKNTRTCRFHNLCYSASKSEWFIVKSNRSIEDALPLNSKPLLYLSSIDNHPYFNWNYIEVDSKALRNQTIRYEQLPHFLFKRLHPENIMHNLHDDVIAMYYQIKKYISVSSEENQMHLAFNLDSHRLLLLDEYEGTGSTRPFQYLSNHEIRFSSFLSNPKSPDIKCFKEAIVGNSKMTKWYQYGFYDIPQGPLDHLPNGIYVREVGEWFIKRLGLELGGDEGYPVNPLETKKVKQADNSHLDLVSTDLIVIMSRTRNRLIVNEVQLSKDLTSAFGLETKILRNMEMTFEEQIILLRRARIVIGMHGSILVMAMFCRRGTVLIEMYPFAVPADHYTPYRTLSNLPNVDIVYRAWQNTHILNTIGHPHAHLLHGGIDTLSPELQLEVINTHTVPRHKCCSSPFWLYRIYQDTIVDTAEVIKLIKDSLVESRMEVLPKLYQEQRTDIKFSTVNDIKCVVGNAEGSLWASWPEVWTGATVEKWEVLVNNDGMVYQTKNNSTSIVIPGYKKGDEVVFFVRPLDGQKIGDWGAAGKCTI